MGELPQYHIAQLARRIYGSKIVRRAEHLTEAVMAIDDGRYETCLDELMNMGDEEIKQQYQQREMEPEMAGEDWRPADSKYL
jgi:hypothetical protein